MDFHFFFFSSRKVKSKRANIQSDSRKEDKKQFLWNVTVIYKLEY